MDSLFTFETTANRDAIPLVQGLLQAQAELLNFDERTRNRLQMAVEEAVLNVVQHAYPDGTGPVIIRASLQQSMLVIDIEDRGLPRDPFQKLKYSQQHPDSPGLGSRLMHATADGVRYRALGRGGKLVEILMRLPDSIPASASSTGEGALPSIDGKTLEVRLFRPEDAGQIAQCAWRCYEYSYVSDNLYLPERLTAMNASGEMLSAVAVDPNGVVYGHAAMSFSTGSPAAESGKAFVVPEARGGGAFQRMKALLVSELARRGKHGYWSEAVTLHPASQKGNIKLGIRECGLELGVIPPTVRMKAIGEKVERRIALMLFYKSLEEQPKSQVCLPRHHRSMLREIYHGMGFTLEELLPALPSSEVHSELKVVLIADLGMAWFRVEKAGADLPEIIGRELTGVCEGGARVVMLDLPKDWCALPAITARLEVEGWGFAGVIPRLFPESDALRLVYLNHVQVDPDRICTASEFGERLKSYVLRDYGI